VSMNRALVSIGAAMALIGAIVLLAVLTGSPAVGESHAVDAARPGLWAQVVSNASGLTAGLLLAAGAALVGIGMNRWTTSRSRA
jgi:hypothetical protein